jgi:hypothetical protein
MLKEASSGAVVEIERIENPSYDEFYRNYVLKNKPVIITGVADKWDALSKWNIDYLRSSSEDMNVDIVVSKGQSTISNQEKGWQTHRKLTMGFKEFLTTIEDTEHLKRYYYLQYQKFDKFPHLLNDFEVPSFIPSHDINTRIWIGSGKNITPVHHDTQSNILTQVRGHKKFTLFPPSESQAMYPFPFRSKNRALSPINLQEPDYEKYPKFKDAHPIVGYLEPGEMIFQPVFWWHQVETLSEDLTISVTFMWKALLRSYFSYLGVRYIGGGLFQTTKEDSW